MFSKLKDSLGVIIALAAVISICLGSMNYFAKASELQMVQMRLDQKIVSDQAHDVQRQLWALEERNREHGSDCAKWPDERDRQQYREGRRQLEELRDKQLKLMRK